MSKIANETPVQMNVRFTEQLAKDGLTNNELTKLVGHASRNLDTAEKSDFMKALRNHDNPTIRDAAKLVQSALQGTISASQGNS